MEAKFNNWIMVNVWWVMLRGMNFAFIRSAFFLLVVMVYVCTYTQPASCSSLLMFFCVLVVVPDLNLVLSLSTFSLFTLWLFYTGHL